MSAHPASVSVKKFVTSHPVLASGGWFAIAALAISLMVWALAHGQYAFPKEISDKFHFAEWINTAEDWLEANFRWLTRAIADYIRVSLEAVEVFLWEAPWPAVVVALTIPALVYGGLGLALFTMLGVLFWAAVNMWDSAMSTLALMLVSVAISVVLGIAVGVWTSQSDRVDAAIKPILDTMQTMPSFVYLIPAIFFFGIGGPSAALAIVIYAMPPAVRLTNLGIRQVSENSVEAARSFGSTRWQLLFKVQLPQALPSIMMGINQTIMMALGLAVLATFIGAGGLGEEVWKALQRLKVGWSLEGGLSIVFMAIIFDRLSLAMSAQDHGGRIVDPSQMTFRLLPQRWLHWQPARFVETGINAIWDAVAAVSIALTRAIAGGLGAIAGLAGPERGANLKLWLKERPGLVIGLFIILAIYAWDAWVSPIPDYPRDWRISLRGPVDDAVKWLAVEPTFIAFTKGLKAIIYLYALNPLDKFFVGLPWWYVMVAFFFICWRSASLSFALVVVASLAFTGLAGLWDVTMYTLAATIASVAISVIIGVPLGVAAAYSRTLDAILRPILDAMQTMPTFVYLIPVLMFFGGNPVTAVIATVIYALPPVIRMTVLGLRQLPDEIDEVSDSFGSSKLQALIKVRLPMASPSIMLGVNQSVVMAFAMQVITPLVAGLGLGKEVFHAMNLADTGRGVVAGSGIVLLAIVLDRLTQAWTKNQRIALGL
jgi:glycine betaine/proline transport system permease protein